MPTITAWQHIYANVNQDLSPTGKSGFQTLAYTHEYLLKGDIEAIEARVFYAIEGQDAAKWFFFKTPSRKIVLGTVRPISEKDDAGRSGLTLAHSLILGSDVFHKTPFDLFDLFHQDIFFKELSDALSSVQISGGNLPVRTFTVSEAAAHERIKVPVSIQRLLIQQGLRASEYLQKGRALALVGSADNIRKTLEFSMLAIPHSKLPEAPFDTSFQKGNLKFTPCWAAGFAQKPVGSQYTIFNVDTGVVSRHLTIQPASSLYERWVNHLLVQQKIPDLVQQKNQADLLCSLLEADKVDKEAVALLSRELIDGVFLANSSEVEGLLFKRVGKLLPPLIVKRFAPDFVSSRDVSARIDAWINGFEMQELLEALYQEYERALFKSPSKGEMKELAQVLEKDFHAGLACLESSWRGEARDLRAMADVFESEELNTMWHVAIRGGFFSPVNLLTDSNAEWVARMTAETNEIEPIDVFYLVERLLKNRTFDVLPLLNPRLIAMEDEQLQILLRLAKRRKGVPDSFMEVLEKTHGLFQAEAGSGLLGFIRNHLPFTGRSKG